MKIKKKKLKNDFTYFKIAFLFQVSTDICVYKVHIYIKNDLFGIISNKNDHDDITTKLY